MKKYTIIAALAIFLGGCATTAQVQSTIANIQTTTKNVGLILGQALLTTCQFVPTPAVLSALLGTPSVQAQSIDATAIGVCAALNGKSVRRGSVDAPSYAGVVLHGKRLAPAAPAAPAAPH